MRETVAGKAPAASGDVALCSAVTMILFAACMSIYVIPVAVDTLIDDLGYSATSAGAVMTAELMMLGMGSLCAPPVVAAMGLRRAAGAMLAIAITAQLFSGAFAHWQWLWLLRAIAGAASGILYGIACTLSGASANPTRNFAIGTTVSGILFALLLAYLPHLAKSGGARDLFPLIGGLQLTALPFILRLREEHDGEDIQSARSSNRTRKGFPLFLLLVLLVNLGLSMIWAFSEQIGVQIGLGVQQIATVLAFSTIANIAGSLLAVLIADRLPIFWPLIVGTAVGAVAAYLVSQSHGYLVYATAFVLYGAGYIFLLPFLISAATLWDSQGRLAAVTGGTTMLAYGAGPLVGGALASETTYSFVGWLSLAALLLAVLLLILLYRELAGSGRAGSRITVD